MKEIEIRLADGCGQEFVPTKAHVDDAAYDCRAAVDAVIPPGYTKVIPLGFHLGLPAEEGFIWEAQIRPRSGLAAKHQISLGNAVGTVDQGYRNEVGAIVINQGKEFFEIKRGDRICQMVITKIPVTTLKVVSVLTETERGQDGFGSTGVK